MPERPLSRFKDLSPFVICLSTALVVALMNSSAPTPLYPLYQQHLHLTTVDLSLIFGAYGVGVLVALLAMTGLANSFQDLRPLFIAASLLVLIGAVAFGHGASLRALCGARLIAGLGSGLMTTVVNIALVRVLKTSNEKLPALLASVAMVGGLALGPLIAGLALQQNLRPTLTPFTLIAVTCVVTALCALSRWPIAASAHAPRKSEISSLTKALHGIGRPFHLCAWSVFFSWSFAACIFVVGPEVAQQTFGLQQRGSFGYALCAYLLIAGISQICCQRLQAWLAVRTGWWVQWLSIVLLLLAIHLQHLYLALIALALAGYAYGALFVGNARLVNQMAPPHAHGVLIAYFYTTVYLFNAAPIPMGWLVDAYGLVPACSMALGAFLALGMALYSLTLLPRFSGR